MSDETFQQILLACAGTTVVIHGAYFILSISRRSSTPASKVFLNLLAWAGVCLLVFLVSVGLCAAGCPGEPFSEVLLLLFLAISAFYVSRVIRFRT
jgi:hypothetical protein